MQNSVKDLLLIVSAACSDVKLRPEFNISLFKIALSAAGAKICDVGYYDTVNKNVDLTKIILTCGSGYHFDKMELLKILYTISAFTTYDTTPLVELVKLPWGI